MKKILTIAAVAAALTASAEPTPGTPQGITRFYDVTAFSQMEVGSNIYAGELTNVKNVIFGNDGTVWFENLSNGFEGEYTKGKLEGDRITLEFPQNFLTWTDEDMETGEPVIKKYDLLAMDAVEMEEDGMKYYTFSISDTQSIEFSYDAESGEIRQTGDKAIAVCIPTDSGYEYYGFADLGYVMTPNPKIIAVTEPEGLEYTDALFTYVDAWEWEPMKRFVKMAKTENSIYVRKINQFLPDAVVRIDKKGDGYWLPTGEYLGKSWGDNIYTFSARFADDMETCDFLDGMEFAYNEETGALTYSNYQDALLLNNSFEDIGYLDGFFMPVFTPCDVPAEAVPASATDLTFYDGNWEYTNSCEISFVVDPMSEDGKPLPDSRLYYELYIDGEAFTFSPEEYTGLEEDMTLIPLMFTDHWDISYNANTHFITFYSMGMETIGIRLYYRNDDGTMSAGNMTVLDLAGVESVASSEDSTYFDLTGRRVANPEKGIYIVKGTNGVHKVMTK